MKARTPTPYTLFAAALGATARSMHFSHTVPHRLAVSRSLRISAFFTEEGSRSL